MRIHEQFLTQIVWGEVGLSALGASVRELRRGNSEKELLGLRLRGFGRWVGRECRIHRDVAVV